VAQSFLLKIFFSYLQENNVMSKVDIKKNSRLP